MRRLDIGELLPEAPASGPSTNEPAPIAKAVTRLHPRHARPRARAAFTLLEVILAIAITGFVLAAATSFVVSISRIWVDREERHFFEDHVDGVTEFLRSSFANAGMEIALETDQSSDNSSTDTDSDNSTPNETDTPTVEVNTGRETTSGDNDATATNGGLIRVSEEPVGWGKPPGFAEYKEPLLNFKLSDVPPLFVNLDNAPIIGIDAFLYFEPDEGLSILWYSLLQEEAEDTDDLRRTEISPLVNKLSYIYWDERFEKWEEEDKPKEGEGNDEYELPRFIKITFEYEGETKERTLTIPVPSMSALLF